MKPSLSVGIEEEYQTIDPGTFDLRSHIKTEIIAKGKRQLDERIKAEMHQSVVEVGTGVCRNMQEARADIVNLRRQMVSLAQDERAAARAPAPPIRLPTGASRTSTPTSATSRSSRTCSWWRASNLIFGLHVHVGIEDRETAHPADEPGPLLPAPPAGAVHELAVLARHEHRAQVVSLQGVRQVSANQHPRYVLELGRLRQLRQPAGAHQLHRQREEDLVGRAAASVLHHARSPDLRHPDAGRRDAGHRRADPGDRRQAVQAARAQPGLSRVQPLAVDGEQVAGLALRHRGQADRLRPAERKWTSAS